MKLSMQKGTIGALILLTVLLSGCNPPVAQVIMPSTPSIDIAPAPVATPTETVAIFEPPELWRLEYGLFLLSLYDQLDRPYYVLNDADADGTQELLITSGMFKALYTADIDTNALWYYEATGAAQTADFFVDSQTGRVVTGAIYDSMATYDEQYLGWDGEQWARIYAYQPKPITSDDGGGTGRFTQEDEDYTYSGEWFYGLGGRYDNTTIPQPLSSISQPDLLNVFFEGDAQFLFGQCEQYFRGKEGFLDCQYGDLNGDGILEMVLLVNDAAKPFWDRLYVDATRGTRVGMFHKTWTFAIVGAPVPEGTVFYPCIMDGDYQDADFSIEEGSFIISSSEYFYEPYCLDISHPNAFDNSVFVPASNGGGIKLPEPVKSEIPSTVTIDVSNPAIYKKLNVFLSNFSEMSFADNEPFSIDMPTSSAGELVCFAFYHNYWNNYKVVEEGDYPSAVTTDSLGNNLRISKENIHATWQRFFGCTFDLPAGSGLEEDDNYYYSLTTGGDAPCGITLVDSATDLGDNLFLVDFHVYHSGQYYDSGDSRLYTANKDTISRLFPGRFTSASSGAATVEAIENSDSSFIFQLRSYELEHNE